jgi:outer membrane protein insertion porin family
VGVSYSKYQKSASFNYFDPYYTIDGVSRGFNVFYRELDYSEANIAEYATDAMGVGVNFGFPIGETQRINFGGTVEYTDITEGAFPAQEVSEFLEENGNDSINYKVNLSWTSSTLNRGLFPTRGRSQSLGMEVAIPGSDLQFYKLFYNAQMYFPLRGAWTLRLRTEVGYGDGYGSTGSLPFYEHFFAGGFGSVRGFETNTLGPRSTPPTEDINGNPIPPSFFDNDDDPFGGNLLVEASAEIIFPLPFIENTSQVRPVIFVDAGNVFNTECPSVSTICDDLDFGLLRYSAGVSVTWLTGLGPMTFGLAKPFNVGEFDEEEVFQFELGRTF